MSARAIVAAAEAPLWRPAAGVAPLVVAAGTILLAARPFALVEGDARGLLFVASYVAIGAAAIALPFGRGRARPAVVLVTTLVGIGALAIASVAGGTPVPTPTSAFAVVASLLAAVAEEALFRRVAYARLERFGVAVAIVGSALLFALAHLPGYGTTAFPVDLGAGLLFGWQRWASGSWTSPALTHAAANILASLR